MTAKHLRFSSQRAFGKDSLPRCEGQITTRRGHNRSLPAFWQGDPEFGYGLTDENVHVLDPFTGTGTALRATPDWRDVRWGADEADVIEGLTKLLGNCPNLWSHYAGHIVQLCEVAVPIDGSGAQHATRDF